jgi:hypothetical protein
MKKSYYTLQLFSCFLFLSTITLAQTGVRDTAFVDQSIAFAREAHGNKTRKQSPLYNGSQYAVYDPMEDEHPYFLKDDWIDGTIVYSGEQFDNISLMYDISSDKVIAEHFAGAAVELITAKVTTFTLDGHVFRMFKKSDDTRKFINEGFYEVLYDGKIKILKRHVKVYTEMLRSLDIIKEYQEKRHYYVVKNNAFYSIGSRASLTKILGDKKRELRRYSRENRLKFGKDENIFIKLAKYYDTLTQ